MDRFFPEKWDVSLLLTLLSLNTTSVYGSLKTLLYPDCSETTHNQLRGVPTEDVAMLNVSERG